MIEVNKETKGVIIKIDLEKAYDRLEWQFIKETLQNSGLPTYIVDTIMRCITNRLFHLLWNGETTGTVKPTHGLWKEDPISPYVFALCLESLAHRIQKEVETRRWKPFKHLKVAPKSSIFFH